MKKIVVLGAGISGLATAWYLQQKYKKSVNLSIIEKSERAGGWIQTLQENDFLFELGPRGFRPSGKGQTTLELVHALDLQEQLLPSSEHTRKRYIWLNGYLRPFSLSFLIRQGILTALVRDLFTAPTSAEDETIADFTTRRFSKRILENLIDPLTKGIFGGKPQNLSVRSCFPLFWNMEQQNGSVIRGLFKRKKEKSSPIALYSFKKGMETLPQALVKKLDFPILFSENIESISEIDADYIISALPTSALARLLGIEDPLKYLTLTTVNFGWLEPVLPKRGYGFLVPSKEQGEILGMTWDSDIFPKTRGTHICVMLGNEKEAYEKALKSLKYYLGITSKPLFSHVHVARHAIPQYALHHGQRMQNFKEKLPFNVFATGNCFEGIGVNDCIFNAKKFVDAFSF